MGMIPERYWKPLPRGLCCLFLSKYNPFDNIKMKESERDTEDEPSDDIDHENITHLEGDVDNSESNSEASEDNE